VNYPLYALPPPESPVDQGDVIDGCPVQVVADFDLDDLSSQAIASPLVRAIVLTQACDLANQKTTSAVCAVVLDAQYCASAAAGALACSRCTASTSPSTSLTPAAASVCRGPTRRTETPADFPSRNGLSRGSRGQSARPSRRRAVWSRMKSSYCGWLKSLFGLSGGPVARGNCVLARGGGEQPEVNPQSAASANSIRPVALTSLRVNGEVRMVSARFGTPPDIPTGRATGGWRRNGAKIRCREGGRPGGLRTRPGAYGGVGAGHCRTVPACGRRRADRRYEASDASPGNLVPSGVRAPVVASKPGNSGRARGRRKVEAGSTDRWNHDRRQCHRLRKSETPRTRGSGRKRRSGPNAC
jgi:hypothetical protein